MERKELYRQYLVTHEKAKDLFVKAYFVNNIERTMSLEEYNEIISKCQSKIEVLFLQSFLIIMDVFFSIENTENTSMYEISIIPQCDIEYSGKTYYVDFNIHGVSFDTELNDEYYPSICVEIDGYDYHSSKQQLNRDRERENFLKKNGENVVRLTGTQVFCSPMESVCDVIEIYANSTHERAEIKNLVEFTKKFFAEDKK